MKFDGIIITFYILNFLDSEGNLTEETKLVKRGIAFIFIRSLNHTYHALIS